MICVSLAEPTPEELYKSLSESASKADLAEIRLDALRDPASLDLYGLMRRKPFPLIMTNRWREEGGAFSGSEEERFSLLERAVEAGADYVDVELRAHIRFRDSLVQKARDKDVRVICSFHDFQGTPPSEQLETITEDLKDAGADIGKIVTFASAQEDVQRVMSLYFRVEGRSKLPLIAFCMGDRGRMSRVACLSIGAYLSFAAPSRGKESAPGQIPLDTFRTLYDYLRGKRASLFECDS